MLHSFETGALDAALGHVGVPELRVERSRARIAALAAALKEPSGAAGPPALQPVPTMAAEPGRRLRVLGAPLAAGLIADIPTDMQIDAPSGVGPAAFALKVCRATLGPGLPAQAIVVLDPDRFPVAGGLAAVREGAAWRLLAVTSQRDGRLQGYAANPELELALDDLDPANLAAVVSAVFP